MWVQGFSGFVRCRWFVRLLLPAFGRRQQAHEPLTSHTQSDKQVRSISVVKLHRYREQAPHGIDHRAGERVRLDQEAEAKTKPCF